MLQVNIKTNLVCEFIKTAYLNFPTSYPACQIRKDTLDQKKRKSFRMPESIGELLVNS